MYASAIPVAVSFFLIWDPPENMTQMELFWFLLIVGAFIRTAITIYEIQAMLLVQNFLKIMLKEVLCSLIDTGLVGGEA